MSESPLVLLVTLEAKQGKEIELKELLTSMVAPSRAESGCIEYRLHCSDEKPGTFMFYEIWKNKAAHAEHGAQPHMAKWHAMKGDLVASAVKSNWEESVI